MAAVIFGCCSCGAPAADPPPAQPADFGDGLALAVAADLNPDPKVVEIALEARVADVELVPGKLTPVWTYNGSLPGPMIRASVGDRVIVHFTNSLPEATTIHWHGVRVPAAMDGAPVHSQAPIEPGQSFDYDFVVPDAGTFWYHPHFDSAAQVTNGLYGAFIVDDPSEPAGLGDELVMIVSDIGVDEQGALSPADSGGDFGTLFGREGNLILVNGRVNPTIHARAGLRQRWRLINAADARYFELSLAGHQFTRIGSDGGLLAEPELLSTLLLTPAQRADVLLEPGSAPEQSLSDGLTLRWHAYDRGFGTAYNRPDEDVLQITRVNDVVALASEL